MGIILFKTASVLVLLLFVAKKLFIPLIYVPPRGMEPIDYFKARTNLAYHSLLTCGETTFCILKH